MNLLVNLIKLFHLLLIIFLLVSPYFSKDNCRNALVILIYIYFKWKVDGSCGITRLEQKLTGKKEEQGFIYRIVNPYLSINEGIFKKKLEFLTILVIVYYFILLGYYYK
jgi:hypothetical protein